MKLTYSDLFSIPSGAGRLPSTVSTFACHHKQLPKMFALMAAQQIPSRTNAMLQWIQTNLQQ